MKSKIILSVSVLFMAISLFAAGRQSAEADIDDQRTITDLEMKEIISAMEFLDQYSPKDSPNQEYSWGGMAIDITRSSSSRNIRTRADAMREQAVEWAQRASQLNKQADISEAEQLQLTKIRRIILKWRVRLNAANQH